MFQKTVTILFVALIVVLLCPGHSSAQMSFAVGPQFGLNFGSMSFDPELATISSTITKGGRFGIMFGANAELEFGKMFAAEMGVIYVQKGAHYDRSTDGASLKIKFNELDLPIHFKVKFLQGRIRPYAFLGPNIGFVMSAGSTSDVPNQQSVDTDFKAGEAGVNVASSIDFSLEFGGGAEFLLTKNIGLTGDVRYNLGLSNIISPPAQQQQVVQQNQTTLTWHASGFQIVFGALFHL